MAQSTRPRISIAKRPWPVRMFSESGDDARRERAEPRRSAIGLWVYRVLLIGLLCTGLIAWLIFLGWVVARLFLIA
jgi:hypothetical protein